METGAPGGQALTLVLCLLLRNVCGQFAVDDVNAVDGVAKGRVTLPCSLTAPSNWKNHELKIIWFKNFTEKLWDCVVEIEKPPDCRSSSNSSRTRISWGVFGKTDLEISALQESDAGPYQCWILLSDAYRRRDLLLRVHGVPTDGPGPDTRGQFLGLVLDASSWRFFLLSGWPVAAFLVLLLTQRLRITRRKRKCVTTEQRAEPDAVGKRSRRPREIYFIQQDRYQQSTRRSQDTMVLVGIFSREDDSCYQWLISKVLACRNVRDVRSVSITNNFQNFQEETLKCDFAILYHSKKRGRINVTNVADSLYDEELKCLSDMLGRRNVLVVIDDLDSSSEEQKYEILRYQTSIGELAQDLFIFSSADKAALNGGGYQTSGGTQRALDNMARIIEGHKKSGNHDIVRLPDEGSPGRRRRPPIWVFAVIVFLLLTIIIIVFSVVFGGAK